MAARLTPPLSEALDRPDPEALSDEIVYDAWRYSERPLSLLLRVFHLRDVCTAKPLFRTVCQVDVVSESAGYERCGPYLHLFSRSSTESTSATLAVGLEEPQEELTRSQLHSFKKQMISQRQQAAHNATQDHIRLRTEPCLDLQGQAGRRTWRRGILPERAHQSLQPDQATD